MKNIRLNKSQQQVAEKYNSFSKTVVVTSFHFVDGKELSTGYCLEDAYQEASLALCMAAVHFNYERGVLFKTYAAAVIRNHLKKVMFSKSVTEIPLEDISKSTDITYEMDAHLEYLEMLSLLKNRTQNKNQSRALSYRILIDKTLRDLSVEAIADIYHLKKSAVYKRLGDARRNFRKII